MGRAAFDPEFVRVSCARLRFTRPAAVQAAAKLSKEIRREERPDENSQAMRRRRIRSWRQLAIRQCAGMTALTNKLRRSRRLSPDEKHANIARQAIGKVNDPRRKMETLWLQIMAPS
jgi:hypothetical protein